MGRNKCNKLGGGGGGVKGLSSRGTKKTFNENQKAKNYSGPPCIYLHMKNKYIIINI